VGVGIAKVEPQLEGSVPALPLESPLQIHADCVSPRPSFHMKPDFDGGVYSRTPVLSTQDSDDQMNPLSGPKHTLNALSNVSSQFGTTPRPACISESPYSTPADILTTRNVSSMYPTLSPTPFTVSKKKKAPKKRDPNTPKKALSPYMFFTQEHREIIKEENPGIGFGTSPSLYSVIPPILTFPR
jgi:HMG (high mobility group) box